MNNINRWSRALCGLGVSGLIMAATAPIKEVRADAQTDLYYQEAMKRYHPYPKLENARNLGMAGSNTVTSPDSSAVVGNPAALGMMKDGEVSVSWGKNDITGREYPHYANEVEDEEITGQVLAAFPINPTVGGLPESGNLGLGWTGHDSDWHGDSYDTQSDGYAISAGYGWALQDNISLGYGLQHYQDDLDSDLFSHESSSQFRHTFGYLNKLDDVNLLGTTLFFGHGKRDTTQWASGTETEQDLWHFGTEVGLSHNISPTTLVSVSADYTYYTADGDVESGSNPAVWVGGDEDGHTFGAGVGVEQALTDNFVARAGYRYGGLQKYDWERDELDDLSGSAKYNAYSAGLGARFPLENQYIRSVNLDYGAEYRHQGEDGEEWRQMATVSLPFGLCIP